MISSNSNSFNKQNSNSTTAPKTRNSVKNKKKQPFLFPSLKQNNHSPTAYQQFFREDDYEQDNDYNITYNNIINDISQKQILAQIQSYPLLYEVYLKNANKPQIHNKIVTTFLKKPSTSDCPGYIYGFMNFNQNSPYDKKHFIKMGRTKQQVPQVRIVQWQKQDNHQYTQIFTVRSQFNNKLQALVHLFFDYARQIRQINGQRRIQWFYFQDRVLTASAVNMINQIMYRIHRTELRTKNNSPKKQIQNGQIIYRDHRLNIKATIKESILKIKKNNIDIIPQKRLVLVGLDNIVLQNVKHLYQGNGIKFINKKFLSYHFQPQLKNNKQSLDFTVDIIALDNNKTQIEKVLIQNFSQWIKIFTSKKIQISVVIKQSDIESSNLSALVSTLQFMQNINIIEQKLSICVFLADKEIQAYGIKTFIIQQEPSILNNQYKKIIEKADFYLIYKPQEPKTIIDLQYKEFLNIKQRFKSNKQIEFSCLQFFHPTLKKVSKSIADQTIFDTIQIFDRQFQRTVHKCKFLTSQQRVNKFAVMTQLIQKVLSPLSHQHQIFISLNQLLKQLSLSFNLLQLDWTIIMMFAFSTCLMERNLKQSKFLEKLKIQIKNEQNSLSQLMNAQINLLAQQCYKNFNYYLNKMSIKYIDGQTQNIDIFIGIINFFEDLSQKYFQRQEQFMQLLVGDQILMQFQQFQKIIKIVQQVIYYQSKGIRCNRVYSKIKQFGIKIVKEWENYQIYNKWKLQTKKIKKLSPTKIQKQQSKQTHKSQNKNSQSFQTTNPEKKQLIQNNSFKAALNTKKEKGTKNKKDHQNTFQINNIRQLLQNIQLLSEESLVMNICKESFHLNLKQGIQIKHSIIILAKKIKASEKIIINVENKPKAEGQKRRKKKYLIMISENYQGLQYINLIKADNWNICLAHFNKETRQPRMLIDKHNQKLIQKLKINNLIDFYRKSIE